MQILTEEMKIAPSYKQIFPPSLKAISNEKIYDALYYINTELPLIILSKIAELPPPIGSEKKREDAKNFIRLTQKMKAM